LDSTEIIYKHIQNLCPYAEQCPHPVTEDSFYNLCTGHKLDREQKPWREDVCAWYKDFKNPQTAKLPRDRLAEQEAAA